MENCPETKSQLDKIITILQESTQKNVTPQENLEQDYRYEIAQLLEIDVSHISKEKESYVIDGKKNLKIKIFSHELKRYPIFFYQCFFDCYIGLVENLENNSKYYPSFQECVFLKETNWWGNTCVDKLVFRKCTFLQSIKVSIKFQKELIFYECIFYDRIIFKDCIFKENVSFYGSKFVKFPIFSQSFFKEDLNLVNTKLDFDYQDMVEEIEKEKNKERHGDFTINDFRDSARLLKNSLIKNNSLIDASNYHCIELYFKELELATEKPTIFSKEWIEKWQLRFYRLISDHHTNLGKILSNVILLIALFGIFALFLNEIKTKFLTEGNIAIQCSCKETLQQCFWGVFQPFNLKIGDKSILAFCFLLGFSLICHVVEWIYHSKSPCAKEMAKNIVSTVVCLILSGISICGGIYLSKYLNNFSPPYLEACTIFLICMSFILVYLGLMLTRGFVLTFLSCVICACILVFKPSLLLPFVGQLFDEGLKANFPAMQSLSVVYCILMFLMLFSLQKTARKNSIIPS